jgi:hypothetical protein
MPNKLRTARIALRNADVRVAQAEFRYRSSTSQHLQDAAAGRRVCQVFYFQSGRVSERVRSPARLGQDYGDIRSV